MFNHQEEVLDKGEAVGAKAFFHRHLSTVDIVAAVIIGILAMTSVFYGIRYNQLAAEAEQMIARGAENSVDQKVVGFLNLFVDDVLNASGEIDFETRLKLEGAVRELDNEQILAAWQTFTNSVSEAEAQKSVKVLLTVLVDNLKN